MDPNELLKMLDLNGKPAQPSNTSTEIPSTKQSASERSEPISPTALELDEWGLRRGRDLVAENTRLKRSRTDAFAAADFFAAAFDPTPKLLSGCADARRHQFLSQMLDTPDYHALHTRTQLDDTASEIAATHFAHQFAELQHNEELRDKPSGAAAGPLNGDGDLASEMAALRAVDQAVAEAGKEVEELHEATAALGLGPGSPGSNDPKAIAALFKQVRGNSNLRRICELAGRFRRVAQSKQRQKVSHGLDDVVGVEPGGDIGRLLPSELLKLAVPELELDTLRRIVEREALCREHHSVEPVGKGPILCVVDQSGSMEGARVHTAKALALALAWIARQQRRWTGLIGYSGSSGERLLALPPGRWNESALCDWLTEFIGGGSDLDVPLVELPRMYREIGAPRGITDIVMITDCKARVPTAVRESFNAWKTSVTARVLTLVIGDRPGDLEQVSDEVFRVPALDPSDDAVGRVLSL
jgi:uncharacterized protein with von Willebrand factor type A (vWA) domain